ncbi:MAG: hypothetical protein C4540_01050 [Candidatus Omnitrophota bacterium]|nr:MAG: hypothetical protein C4540_01050 [Candidatus Omnitrophota bacterium]
MNIRNLAFLNKKIIIAHLAIVFVLLAFWLFIYLPRRNAAVRIRAELTALNNQIEAIEGMMDNAKTLDEGLARLKAHYKQINRFPPQEEEAVRLISEYAHRFNIAVRSLKTQPRMPFFTAEKQLPGADEGEYQSIAVAVELSSSYVALVRYIQILQKSLPAFVTIEKLQVTQDKNESKNLNSVMVLKLYLLSEK